MIRLKLSFFRLFAGIFLFGLFTCGAWAQSSCTSTPPTATPVFVRAEGTSEQLGDVTFSCSTSPFNTPGSASANVTVYLSPAVTITSKILNSSTAETEALIVTGAGQSVRGIVSGSSVTFTSVPIPTGGTSLTITNVRANASQLASSTGGPTSITETIFVGGTNIIPAVLSPQTTVAYVTAALSQTSPSNTTFSACASIAPTSGPAFTVNFAEAFPSALKTQGNSANIPLGNEFVYNTETGFYQNVSGTNNIANSGTRIRVVFTNVPAGVSVYVPTTVSGSGQTSNIPTLSLTATESGAFSAVAPTTGAGFPAFPAMAAIPITSGTGQAVYEVTAQDPLSYEAFTLPVYLNASSASLTLSSTPITATVNLAPVGSSNVPHFVVANSLIFNATPSAACLFTISPSGLPAAAQNAPYSQQLIAGPGSGALTWSISAGSLPTGLNLNSVSGLLNGSLLTNGTFNFTVTVSDQTHQVSQAFTLVVNPPVSGGPTTCSNSSNTTNLIRAEGLSEQLGDFTISCAGGGGSATVSVSLSPGLTITSKVLASANGDTEATAVTSAGTVPGVVQGSNVVFYGVPIPAGSSTITITNIRVNATPLLAASPTAITETAFISGSYISPAFLTGSNPVAYALPSLVKPYQTAVTYAACSNLTASSGAAFLVNIGEAFPSAFKTQGGAGNTSLGSEFSANTETGFYRIAGAISNIANSGTRIRVVFTNVPAGVSVFVPTVLTGTGQTATVPLLSLTTSETGIFAAVAPVAGGGLPTAPALAQIAISGGTGVAVYEVSAQDPSSLEAFAMPVYLSGSGAALSGAAQPIRATVNLAPTGTTGIPSFAVGNSVTFTATASATCSLSIRPTVLSAAIKGASYSQPLLVGPGTGALTWSITAGALPGGLMLDPVTGAISGVPTVTGSFSFTAKAVDQANGAATHQFTLQVNAPVIGSGFLSTCGAQSNAVFLRAEGATERVADTTISCTGGGGTATLQVFLSPTVSVTSKFLAASGATEAVAITNAGAVQGVVVGSSVLFYGVQVPSGSSTITLANIRVNASEITLSSGVPIGVNETILLTGPAGPQTIPSAPAVGFVISGLGAPGVQNVTNYAPGTPIVPSNGASFKVHVSAGFYGALKTKAEETGTPVGSGNAADSGSRIRVLFQNVPAGFSLYVPVSLASAPSGTMQLTASETGPFSAVAALAPSAGNGLPSSPGLAQISLTSGSGVAVYETTSDSTGLFDTYDIPVFLGSSTGVATISFPIRATVTYAPLNTPANIPNFVVLSGSTPLTASAFTTTLATGITGVPYNPGGVALAVSGGVAPYAFSGATLPAGLSISSTGVISGTPTTASGGLFAGSVTIADSTNATFTLQFSIRILAALSITTSSLPATPLNVAYTQTVAVQGGTPGYTYSVPANSLPPGLTLNTSTGAITGSATTPGNYSFTVTVTDNGTVGSTGLPAQVATQAYQIQTGLTITSTGPLYPAFINAPYSTTLTAANGSGALAWTVTAGALPNGMTLAPATGALAGTPTAPGIYNFTVNAADSAAPNPTTQTRQYSLTVAQQYVISTIAGGVPPVTPQPAVNASIGQPGRPATDSGGNVYFASFNSIFKVDSGGTVTRVAGNGRPGYSGDGGPATAAQLSFPAQVAVDGSGNLYIADSGNLRIRKVSAATGVITTIAGNGNDLVGLSGVAVDAAGNVYFSYNIHIDVLTPTGVRTNYFAANFIQFPSLPAITADSAGNVYFTNSAAVYKVSPAGIQTVVAGTPGTTGYSGDGGPATGAVLWFPRAPAFDTAGNLFIYDSGNGRIRKVSTEGTITTVIGPISWPASDIALDGSGNFYGNATFAHQITKVSSAGIVSVAAGNGTYEYSGDGGQAAAAQVFPSRVAVDPAGNVFFSNPQDGYISLIRPDGSIGSRPLTAVNSVTASPQGLALNLAGSPPVDFVYYADSKANQVFVCLPALGCSAIAGTGSAGSLGNGNLAVNAGLSAPTDVARDAGGNIYIADTGNNRIQKIDSQGVISTFAGTGSSGFSGDGLQATNAQLNGPAGLAIFGGSLYIADTGNNRVRMVNSTGVISTVAGTESSGPFTSGGPAVSTRLNAPAAISLDSQGNLYILDQSSFVWRVTTDGLMNAIAGTASVLYSGDGGPAKSAAFAPTGIAIDGTGHIYLATSRQLYGGDAIRVLTPSTAAPLTILTTTLPATSAGAAGYLVALAGTGGTGSYTWSVLPQALPPGLSLDAATGVISGTAGATGSYDFTVTVTDSGTIALTGTPAQTISQNFRVNVSAALTLSSAVLPVATTNVAYSTNLIAASGGTPAFTYSITNGSLPNGMNLSAATGGISGAASVAGSYGFAVKVTDSGTTPQSVTQVYQLTVQAPPVITTSSLPGGAQGKAYNTTIAVAPGTPPYAFAISSGTLTSGLLLNPSTGTISGTPTVANDSNFTLAVTDSGSPAFTVSRTYTIRVYSPIVMWTPSPLQAATATAPYTLALKATGGSFSGYTWSATGLPGWLGLTAGGVFSGTPPSAGAVTFNLSVTDGIQTLTTPYTLPVNAPTGQVWTQLTPTGTSPPAHIGQTTVFDQTAGQMIIFGGDGQSNEVWSYGVSANAWTHLTPIGTAPPARGQAAAAYNPSNSRMMIFGGGTTPTSFFNDVWVLTNANAIGGTPQWTALTPSGTLPAVRSQASLGYDPGSNRMIVFGGQNVPGPLYDVWVLTNADGTGGSPTWLPLSPTGTPPTAWYSSGSYDPATNRLIVFGGINNQFSREVWVLSNANGLGGVPVWTQEIPTGDPITPRMSSTVFDSASNRMFVFGGETGSNFYSSDTWILANANGVGSSPAWRQLAPTGTTPPPRVYPSVSYDASADRLIVFGGFGGHGASSTLSDLWSLSNVTGIPSITNLSPSSVIAGGSSVALTVTGQNFARGAVILWNGTALATTFVSPAQLTASVPAGNVSAATSASVTVRNPGGALSAASLFTVTSPAPPTGGGGGGTPPAGNPLTATPASLTFDVASSAASSTKTVALTYPTFTAGAPSFSASFNTNQGTGWLSVSPTSGTMTQQESSGLLITYGTSVTIAVSPTGFVAGNTYTGTVNLSSAGGIVSVPVTMNVISKPAKFTAAPSALSFDYQVGAATAPGAQTLTVFSTPTGASFTPKASTTSGGNWLVVSPSTGGVTPGALSVSVSTTGIAPGSYVGQIALAGGDGTSVNVPVSLVVTPAQLPKISISPATQAFTLAQSAAATAGQISVSNAGGGTLQFSASASSSPSGWLKLTGSGPGAATTASPVSQGFTIDPTGLSPGAYTGQITFTDTVSNNQATASITLAVRQASPSLSLSRSGLTFTAVQNGPTPPTQAFTVTNSGQGSSTWTATANMLTNSGSNWLQVSPSGGTATEGQAGSSVTVTLNQAGLAPGQYYGSVDVSAQNAINSPQSASVLLNVVASGAVSPGPTISTGGLVFIGKASGAAPSAQQVTIFNPSSTEDGYTASVTTSDGGNWLSVDPAIGGLNSGTTSVSVSTTLTGVAAGVHTGTITLAFNGGGSAVIQVALIVTAATGSAVSGLQPLTTFGSACPGGKAGYLVPVFAAPVAQQAIQAGQASLLRVFLYNDCGSAVTSGNGGLVQVNFSNGDASVKLSDTGGGVWEGTWTPANAASQAAATVIASQGTLPSIGATISVPLLAATANSAGLPGGVVNAASQAAAVPQVVTPGSYITIYGTNLAGNGQGSASTIPLPFNLNGTKATLGDLPMPLLYAGPGQINALVPQSLNSNAAYPLVVLNGSTRSVPVPLTVVSTQPAVYTSDLSGSGQGVVGIAGTTLLAGPQSAVARPAIRGTDYLVIYCTGLGPVKSAAGGAAPADGAGAPSTEVFQTTGRVSVSIGGASTSTLFAGLTPTLVGLYQINVQVPPGAPAGDAIPLVVTVTDPDTGVAVSSNTVTVALR